MSSAALDDNVPSESVNGLYPVLMREARGSIAAFISDASFSDIGTPLDCLRTSLALAVHEGDRLVSEHARIEPTAVVERTAIWDDVRRRTRATPRLHRRGPGEDPGARDLRALRHRAGRDAVPLPATNGSKATC